LTSFTGSKGLTSSPHTAFGGPGPGPSRAEPGRAWNELSGWELDLLVTGYLSAVAHELRGFGLIETSLQIGRAVPSEQLSGCLTLQRTDERSAVVILNWDEESGWTADIACEPYLGPARRYLHPLAVPDPRSVAEVVVKLCVGHDAGLTYPPAYPEHDYGRSRGHARVVASLARFAIPEVRRWLDVPDDAERAITPRGTTGSGSGRCWSLSISRVESTR
jgi:hypothetical protein